MTVQGVAIWVMVVILLYVFVTLNMQAGAQVPVIVDSRPAGMLENGKVRVYEIGPQCYVAVGNGPMGGLLLTGFCR